MILSRVYLSCQNPMHSTGITITQPFHFLSNKISPVFSPTQTVLGPAVAFMYSPRPVFRGNVVLPRVAGQSLSLYKCHLFY